jgi:hypothetical protein
VTKLGDTAVVLWLLVPAFCMFGMMSTMAGVVPRTIGDRCVLGLILWFATSAVGAAAVALHCIWFGDKANTGERE